MRWIFILLSNKTFEFESLSLAFNLVVRLMPIDLMGSKKHKIFVSKTEISTKNSHCECDEAETNNTFKCETSSLVNSSLINFEEILKLRKVLKLRGFKK
jgi:hypothetical protein